MMDISWMLTFLVAVVTWFLTRHWLKTKSFPPGPFPLPIVGNLLSFRSKTFNDRITEYRQRYGKIFTVWFGSHPYVIVSDQRLIKEGLLERKTDFASRPHYPAFTEFTKGSISVTFSEYSKQWEILRKMGHSAIRKYAVSEHLPQLIDDLTKETVEKMEQQQKPFHPFVFIHSLTFNVIVSAIAGEKLTEDTPEIKQFLQSMDILTEYLASGIIAHFIPLLKFVGLYRGGEKEIHEIDKLFRHFVITRIKEHIQTYQASDIRDIIDSLLSARDEAVAEFGEENTPHLNDDNIFQVIIDIFGAGTDTTSSTLRWLILFVAMHPEIQDKMIDELRGNIGDRIPTQEDRRRCPYTTAVIHETMRLRPIAPYGLPHMAIRDSQIGGFSIPKDTPLLFHYDSIHSDAHLWKQPDKFMPERFLSPDGSLNDASRMGVLVPFGFGRRGCIGEKLAAEEIFLVTVGIFRRCRLVLDTPPKDTKTDTAFFESPKHHTVTAVRLDDL